MQRAAVPPATAGTTGCCGCVGVMGHQEPRSSVPAQGVSALSTSTDFSARIHSTALT